MGLLKPRHAAASASGGPTAGTRPTRPPVALVSRPARTVAASRVAAVDAKLLNKLARLDLAAGLPNDTFKMGNGSRQVRMVKVRAEGLVLAARMSGGEKEIIAPVSKFPPADRAEICLVLARAEPANRSLYGLAGFYFEVAGKTGEADRYFGMAGDAARAQFERLFDE